MPAVCYLQHVCAACMPWRLARPRAASHGKLGGQKGAASRGKAQHCSPSKSHT